MLVRSSSPVNFYLYISTKDSTFQIILYAYVTFPKNLVKFDSHFVYTVITAHVVLI